MSNWEDDPFALDGEPSDAEFEGARDGAVSDRAADHDRGRRVALLLVVTSVAAAVAALALGSRGTGWAAVAAGAAAYFLAVAADLRSRRTRRVQRHYNRPWATALLRLAVFWTALGAAWLAASGLAAA